MTLREKSLYHQIHPFKLGTDVAAQIVATYFFWNHSLIVAFVVMLIPPIIMSAFVINMLDLANIKDSAVGRYLKRSMTRGMETIRLLGTVPIVLGAWYHMPWLIGLGIIIILYGWLRGVIFPGKEKNDTSTTIV